MCWAIKESSGSKKRKQVPYARLLLEIFHQSGLLNIIKKIGVSFDKDLGTCNGRILNARTLGYMKIVDPSKVKILKTDMTGSEISSDLMVEFPPISKEDPLEVLAAYVLQHFEDTGDVIAYCQIPLKLNVPLKIARKRITKDESDEEDVEEKPKAKKGKKAKVSEPAAPDIQEEVPDLEPVQVMEKRTIGGSSEDASQPKKKVQKQVKKTLRKLVESKYIEEEDAEAEEASTLVTRMVRNKQAEAAEMTLEMSSDP